MTARQASSSSATKASKSVAASNSSDTRVNAYINTAGPSSNVPSLPQQQPSVANPDPFYAAYDHHYNPYYSANAAAAYMSMAAAASYYSGYYPTAAPNYYPMPAYEVQQPQQHSDYPPGRRPKQRLVTETYSVYDQPTKKAYSANSYSIHANPEVAKSTFTFKITKAKPFKPTKLRLQAVKLAMTHRQGTEAPSEAAILEYQRMLANMTPPLVPVPGSHLSTAPTSSCEEVSNKREWAGKRSTAAETCDFGYVSLPPPSPLPTPEPIKLSTSLAEAPMDPHLSASRRHSVTHVPQSEQKPKGDTSLELKRPKRMAVEPKSSCHLRASDDQASRVPFETPPPPVEAMEVRRSMSMPDLKLDAFYAQPAGDSNLELDAIHEDDLMALLQDKCVADLLASVTSG